MIAIAIDGPAGAGKSTIARRLAGNLGYIYVDTGALYRAVALYMCRQGIDMTSEPQVTQALRNEKLTVDLIFTQEGQQVVLCGEDVTGEIRTPEISMAASCVSAMPSVRRFLFDLQRELAEKNNVVMDGRDIGTVVLPHAQVKIFLTAAPEERARRRYEELREKGQAVEYAAVLREVKQRDEQDSTRAIAPLKQAEDAVLLDTTQLNLEESVQKAEEIVKQRAFAKKDCFYSKKIF